LNGEALNEVKQRQPQKQAQPFNLLTIKPQKKFSKNSKIVFYF
jgi:hypothetical protein